MADERSTSRVRAVRTGKAAAVSGAEVAGRATSGTEGRLRGAAGDKFEAPAMKSGENAMTPAYRTRVARARANFNARGQGQRRSLAESRKKKPAPKPTPEATPAPMSAKMASYRDKTYAPWWRKKNPGKSEAAMHTAFASYRESKKKTD